MMDRRHKAKIAVLESAGEFAFYNDIDYVVSPANEGTYYILSSDQEPGFSPRKYGKEGFLLEVVKEDIKYGYAIRPSATYCGMNCSIVTQNLNSDTVSIRTSDAIDIFSVKDRDTYLTDVQISDPKLRITPVYTRAFDLPTKEEYDRNQVTNEIPLFGDLWRNVNGVKEVLDRQAALYIARKQKEPLVVKLRNTCNIEVVQSSQVLRQKVTPLDDMYDELA